jgi:type I site-specific restriction-modification system R (restriction) subunit
MRAIIGNPLTLQHLFVDDDSVVFDPITPTITIFYFQGTTKSLLVDEDPILSASPLETGRYAYVYTVTDAFVDGDTLFVEIVGTHPISSKIYRERISLELTVPARTPGITTRFIS